MPRILLLLAVVSLWVTETARAQRLRVEGDVAHPAVLELRQLVERGQYRVLDRDTVLGPGSRLEGDLLVLGATVRLQGEVTGSVGLVNASLFLRPGSRVVGTVVSAGTGGIFPSTRSAVGDTASVPPAVGVRLTRQGDEYLLTLTPPASPPWLRPAGVYGATLPTYDRVNGVTLRTGVNLRLGADSAAPLLAGRVAVHGARRTLSGAASLLVPLAGHARLAVGAGRQTQTNEQWIRGDLGNSAAALVARSDARNYWESDFLSLALRANPRRGLVAGEGFVAPRLELRASRDRSLRARGVYSVLRNDRPWRPNPTVLDGELISARIGAVGGWRGQTARTSGSADLEVGRTDPVGAPPPTDPFAQLALDGRWAMTALRGHALAVRTHTLLSLASQVAPAQRWSSVGGTGTLPALQFDEMRGDNLVFVQSTYLVPLPRPSLPLLGPPGLVIQHAVGTAWISGTPAPGWSQDLAAGLQFSLGQLLLHVDPADPGRPTLSIGLTLP